MSQSSQWRYDDCRLLPKFVSYNVLRPVDAKKARVSDVPSITGIAWSPWKSCTGFCDGMQGRRGVMGRRNIHNRLDFLLQVLIRRSADVKGNVCCVRTSLCLSKQTSTYLEPTNSTPPRTNGLLHLRRYLCRSQDSV